MFSTPRPSRRTPRSPDAFPFPRRRWAAAAAAALALGSLSACGPGTDGAAGGSRVSATTGAGGTDGGSGATAPGDVHRLALPLPEEVGTLRLEGLWPFTTHEKLLKQHSQVPDLAVQEGIQAGYREAEPTGGREEKRYVVFTGYDVTISADQQKPGVDDLLQRFLVTDEPSHDAAVPGESFGGYARCVTKKISDGDVSLCAWADDGTVGVLSASGFTAGEAAELLPSFRTAVVR
jgi:hypothetical protein